ncbi:MAG: hypothetical protein IKO40_08970 [Kiritimatiellae bacterium]|nr:hypothetical protein [Kiritimatiellia bacterium]
MPATGLAPATGAAGAATRLLPIWHHANKSFSQNTTNIFETDDMLNAMRLFRRIVSSCIRFGPLVGLCESA